MGDPYLTMRFAEAIGNQPSPLAALGQGLNQVQQTFRTRDLEGQYNEALNTALTNPTNENISQLYQIAEPLGRFPNARTAIQDLFARMPQDAAVSPEGAVDPNLAAFYQAFDDWEVNPTNDRLRNNLFQEAMNVDRFDEIQDIVTARVEEVKQEQAAKTEHAAQQEYFENPTAENRTKWYDAARANNSFEEANAIVEGLTEEQRLTTVKEGLDVFGPLAHGAPDIALENINRSITAARDMGEDTSDLEALKGLVEDGRIQEAMGVLGTTLGAFEEGQAGMDTALAMAANRREGESHVSNMIKRAIETEIADEEMRERLQEVWKDSPVVDFGLGSVLIDMAQVFEDEELGEDQKLNAVMSLRNQYLGETEEWQNIHESNAKVRQAALRAMAVAGLNMPEEAIGAADLTLVNSFQRLIDPATVRESDIANMRSTIGGFDQVEQWVENFRTGAKFSPEQRRTIMQVASQISGVYSGIESRARDFIDTYAPKLGETTEDVIGKVVFDPYDEEKQLQEFKDVLIGIDPGDASRINSVRSLDELKRQYPKRYEYLTSDTIDSWGGGWDDED